jgi:hypothetical protein
MFLKKTLVHVKSNCSAIFIFLISFIIHNRGYNNATVPCPRSHVDTRKQILALISASMYKCHYSDKDLWHMRRTPVRNYHP